ncbi:MAG: hypothetical protein ACE5GQ_11940, partial [Nitrospinales bacterium]
MLFITNRSLNEGKDSKVNRKISFNLKDSEPSASAFFCSRKKKDDYVELMSAGFFEKLRRSSCEQILLYIHGFNNFPEKDIFPRAQTLQELCDREKKGRVQVVPMIWPCDTDFG